MGYKETYNRWLRSDVVDDDTKAELKSIENNEKEIEERFYRELEFGTAGMRGIIGAGTNRINIYNVRRASQGVAKYVLSNGEDAAKAGVLSYRIIFKSVTLIKHRHNRLTDRTDVRQNLFHDCDLIVHFFPRRINDV